MNRAPVVAFTGKTCPQVLSAEDLRKPWFLGVPAFKREQAIRLNLKNIGEHRGHCRDVLIIPSRFFDKESEISWNTFLNEIQSHVLKKV